MQEKTVILVDDEEGVRTTLETILVDEGFKVETFESGSVIADHIRKQMQTFAPSVALVDLRLPDMNGIQVMQMIKEISPETEVVMLTGNPDMTSAIESVNAGAYAYLLKPCHMDEIKNLLDKITERQALIRENRNLTEKLKKWNEKLEDEVYRRTVALQDSYRRLELLYNMRTQFVAIMSHELRTPTTAIMGFADTLRDKWQTLPSEKIQDYLGIISAESNRLVMLMSEIFEISRIHEGKLQLHREGHELVAFLKDLIGEFRSRYPTCSFGFNERGEAVNVSVDPIFFKSAINHALLNAVKYNPPGGHILIFMEKKGEQIHIRIEDDGPGIPRDLRDKVFEPFFRSMDDVNRKTPGAGLGLAISKGILQAMNGTIRIADKMTGKSGCAVIISLPISNPISVSTANG